MKQHWAIWVSTAIIMFILCLGVYAVTASHLTRTAAILSEAPPTIVIDPGHGGEDGGAISVGGRPESKFNLEIAVKLDQLLSFCGCRTAMTRSEDVSVYTGSCDTLSEKKRSDLKNRVHMVNAIHPAILVSIHQNQFSDEKYSGAQVFYAGSDGSQILAEKTQNMLRSVLNPENHRDCKRAETIYLLEEIHCPGILVECVFLSHRQEELLLQQEDYQKKMVCSIAGALVQFIQEGKQYGKV